jgi:hypothetical protein
MNAGSKSMTARLELTKVDPNAHKAMMGLQGYGKSQDRSGCVDSDSS